MFNKLMRVAWILSAGLFVLFVTQPIGIKLHFAFSVVSIAAMIAISWLRLGGIFRHIFLALGSIIIIRYVYWRITETIPDPTQVADFIPGMLLLIADLFCITMLGLGLFVNAQPITRNAAPQLKDEELPSVDVFVPSYNEERDLVATTLAAAKALDYPHNKLKVFLLDDGGTDEKVYSFDHAVASAARARRSDLQQLCADLGVTYLTRERNLHAKAGNLNNGLAHSAGDLVVVFDADHVPAREFLRETVGHFATEPKLFLVQTPHFFINADPLERNLQTFKSMPSENEMFYGAIQKGLDSWNAAFFCGSAAVLRRAALDEVGGFAGVTITEDCESALELHSRGWKSLYVDKPLIAGLQPETFESFIGQRSRWCRGMLQIFMLKNPLFNTGLSLPQRLCYTSSNLFWLFPLSRLIFMISPLFFILFNLQIYNASPQSFVAYTLTYILAVILIQHYLYGSLRWPWISELYEYIQSVYLFRAVMSVIANPRAPKFNVTQKGNSLAEDELSPLAWPFYAIFAFLLATLAYTGYRYVTEPAARDLLVVIGAWNVFNTVMAGLALGVVSERRERRKIQRLETSRRGSLSIGDLEVPVIVKDASVGGLKVQLGGTDGRQFGQLLAPGRHAAMIRVESETGAPLQAQVAITSATSADDSRMLGLRFLGDGADRYRIIADVAYADLSAMREMRAARQNRQSLVLGTARTLVWAAREAMRGMFFLLFRRSNRPGAAGQQAGATPAATPAQTGMSSPLSTAPATQPAALPAQGTRLPEAVGLGEFRPATTA
ncbi:MAG TPA: UDP-forming cellulose synthase catalytic subunit [Bosea sp. (in: a-proteobacteria)]|jgi:cellulose synthase (UDP-forming)|uniref:UDP-forming cellulose synthase catalytic subunit n=1 Tax=Bosea sp. (in: a-proteobacteria) TaxID=1871050 RepID=UPI002E12CF47|nr:UDP-forming cellulose synthase catalytic subunit [Bosea sp. (in: a-proteobacteria)]